MQRLILTVLQAQYTVQGHRIIFGKILWLSVDVVVILTRNHQQAGDQNEVFVSLLGHLCEGQCMDTDYRLLSSRVMDTSNYDPHNKDWKEVPVLVSKNSAKDTLNEKAAICFAKEHQQELHWYHAKDMHRRKVVVDDDLKSKLQSMHSGTTKQHLGRIPLCAGMPVLVTHHFDVEGGIANGSKGIVKQIRYFEGEHDVWYLKSCVVHIKKSIPECMPQLVVHNVPILPDVIDMTFTHPYTKKSCVIKCTQVPVMPAFAMTAHCAQGQAVKHVIIDLESCCGTEVPYVMVS